ncbi:uncharacterized protein KIAA0513 homolog isoform X2 [Narcine bancroftii]|uniref:uncharacterized protein KIAA0513 homolog isoform X2 n=1 Tax=Narcine bancroftii TaxID=1343680 RepID=UPI003831EDD1
MGTKEIPLENLQDFDSDVIKNEPVSLNKAISSSHDQHINGTSRSESDETESADSDLEDSPINTTWDNSRRASSVESFSSHQSLDTVLEDEVVLECREFMRQYVEKIFTGRVEIGQEDKARFGELCSEESSQGREWFAKYVSAQRCHSKCITEHAFYRLVQSFAVVLFELLDSRAQEKSKNGERKKRVESMRGTKVYLYTHLKQQPIWHSLRFWNAAFFDAVHCERRKRSPTTREKWYHMTPEERDDTHRFDENIAFGQLGTFTQNMLDFGLSKELCTDFLKKQSVIGNLNPEQYKLLCDHIEQKALE